MREEKYFTIITSKSNPNFYHWIMSPDTPSTLDQIKAEADGRSYTDVWIILNVPDKNKFNGLEIYY